MKVRVKFNMAFQADGDTGQTINECIMNVYIDYISEKDFPSIKGGLEGLCDGMKTIIKGGEN